MKTRDLIAGFVALFFTSFFISSCLNDDNKIPPNCYDGILNNSEFLLDCGGPNCPACDHCINGIWEPELGETCRDCGGECDECDPCYNCIQDGDEVGIDCGGSCNIGCDELCDDGMLNGTEEEIDCGGFCDACPTCTDLEINGDEVGIDCGGDCPPCTEFNNCTNGVIDGDELWIDCGTDICYACDTILQWKANGVEYVVTVAQITFSITGGTLNIQGLTPNGATIVINVEVPGTGWESGIDVPLSVATIPSGLGYSDPGGTAFSTSFGNSTASLHVVRYIDDVPPGIFRGTFQGTLSDVTEDETVSITNGLFQIPLD